MTEDSFVFPVSFAQQRLWFLDQMEPGSAAYNVATALRLRGTLDVTALERSLNEVVRRHETLRTTFAMRDGQPVQVIAPELTLPLPLVDLRALPSVEREAAAGRLAGEEARRLFDLRRGPLLRATLLRLDGAEHVLLLTVHHIVSDGWSMGVLKRELAALYTAYVQGQPSPLPELPIQYADFAVWQREWLQGPALAEQLAYWKERLAGAPATLDLPTDRPRPPVQTFRGARRHVMLSEAATAGLAALCRGEDATPFMALVAAFGLLLHRYSGQDDLVIGSPIAGRQHTELEGLIGFFISTLALRLDLSGNPTFRQLLARVRAVALGAYAHQDIPFEKLVEELHPDRDPSRNPLFQVMVNLLNVGGPNRLDMPGLVVETIAADARASKFDLTLYAAEQDPRLRLSLAYNTDLFTEETIGYVLRHLQTLLEGIVADPDRRVRDLPIHSDPLPRHPPAPAAELLSAAPFSPWSRDEIAQSIPRRFAQQVREQGTRLAVKTATHAWTYAQLDAASGGVARALLAHVDGAAGQVALLCEHDAPMIAAMLGALKAGQTYVPLDPSYPRQRLSSILRDAGAGTIVADEHNLALAGELAARGLKVVALDAAIAGTASNAHSGADPAGPGVYAADPPDLSPDTPAYILYTSGSTGEPKGIVQTHRNVLHFIRAYTNSLRIGPHDRLTLLSSYTHDAAVVDVFAALLNGATLYPKAVRADGLTALADWIAECGITIYHSVPTLFRHLVDALPPDARLAGPRCVVLGGEEVVKRDVALCRKHFAPDCPLVNLYGSTESTISLINIIDRHTEITRHAVPIGYAVEDTEVLVLDDAGRAADVYGIGHIAVRSAHVAPGYWNRPALSALTFLPDPDGGERRTYRTGDMGRLLPDGRLEFVGRADHQVKIRGYRVEAGEVEAALRERAALKEAVVVAREDRPGERRLVAYVVPHRGGEPAAGALRQLLQERLPAYMVPSAFVCLPALPLTPSGKIDRRALPQPSGPAAGTAASSPAPHSALERTIAAVWRETLRLEHVGAHDNFFDLGGHSLLLLQVHSKLSQSLPDHLTMVDLFRYPTISALAAYVEQRRGADGAGTANAPGAAGTAGAAEDASAASAERSFRHLDERARQQQEAIRRRQRAMGKEKAT